MEQEHEDPLDAAHHGGVQPTRWGPRARPPPEERPQDRFEDLFELAPEPYLLTDGDGHIKLANERTAELLGRGREEVKGRRLAEFIHPDDREGLAQQLRRAGDGSGTHAWEVRLADGAVEPRVLASVEPFETSDDGLELRWALWDALPLQLMRDRMQRLLDDTRGDAAALRALVEWQASLLGSAAQDMRTPLDVVSSTLDALLEDPATLSTPVARTMLERAAHQVVRLRRMLPTLLQLGRLQLEDPATERAHVSVQRIVDGVLHDLGPLARDVTCRFDVGDVHADADRLARAVLELVRHAVEDGPPGAALRIGTRARGVDVEVFLDVEGYALTDDVREVLFSPFLGTGRGSSERHGDDLGLSLVAVFARMHGGRAWAEATADGTSFRILLSNALPDTHREADPP